MGVTGYLVFDKFLSNKVVEQPNNMVENNEMEIAPDDDLLKKYHIIIQTWISDYIVDDIFVKDIFYVSEHDKLYSILF